MEGWEKLGNAIASYCLEEVKLVLKQGVDTEVKINGGLTALHLAVKRNFIGAINLLLERDASVNVKDSDGCTPLHYAVLARNTEITSKLLNKGAEVDCKDGFGLTALHMAAFSIGCELFDCLLSYGADCNIQDLRGRAPLEILKREYEAVCIKGRENEVSTDDCDSLFHKTIKQSHINLLKELLKSEVNIHGAESNRQICLLHAINNNLVNIVTLLIEAGADPNMRTEGENQTPILCALAQKNLIIMTKLIDKGADMNVWSNARLGPPLIIALKDNFESAAELLIDKGAEVNVADENGDTPLDYVVRNNNFNLFKKLIRKGAEINTEHNTNNNSYFSMLENNLEPAVGFYLENKFNIDMKDEYNRTILHFISSNGSLVELFLKNGAAIDAKDLEDETPLIKAIRRYSNENDDESGVVVLCERGADPNLKNYSGKTSLHFAVNNIRFMEILVSKGANIEAKDSYDRTPLFSAVSLGDDGLRAVDWLLRQGVNVNAQDCDGSTPLHLAVGQERSIGVINMLLSYGADLEIKEDEGHTPLFEAISKYVHGYPNQEALLEQITVFLQKGANVNTTDNSRRTVMHCEDMDGFLFKKLIDAGVDVNIKDSNGQTPLHIACSSYGDLLLGRGADLMCENNDNVTPIQVFLSKERIFNSHISSMKPLLNAKNIDGCSPLHVAAQNCWFNCVRNLIKLGFDVNCKDRFGATPLHLAVESDGESGVMIVEELLDHHAAIDEQNGDGRTPLYLAVSNRHEDAVEALIVRGARMEIADKEGETPLILALSWGGDDEENDVLRKFKEHIVKLKAAGLEEELTCHSDSVDCSAFGTFRESCLKEIELMKVYKCCSVQLLDIFYKKKDPTYVEISELKEIIGSSVFKLQFPIYASLLRAMYHRNEQRYQLLNDATVMFNNLISRHQCLPNEILRKILSELSNVDLLSFFTL